MRSCTKRFRVKFDGKVLVPEGAVDLPVGEAFDVCVETDNGAETETRVSQKEELRPLQQLYRKLREVAPPDHDLPTDLAAQHDHYLYGTLRK